VIKDVIFRIEIFSTGRFWPSSGAGTRFSQPDRRKNSQGFGNTPPVSANAEYLAGYNLPAMKCWYWTVICSTPTCSKRHFAKFIVEDRGSNKFLLEDDLPGTFFHQCEKCGKVHSYTTADLLLFSLNSPLLHGLREWW
jgi:hypothetical protein